MQRIDLACAVVTVRGDDGNAVSDGVAVAAVVAAAGAGARRRRHVVARHGGRGGGRRDRDDSGDSIWRSAQLRQPGRLETPWRLTAFSEPMRRLEAVFAA